MGVASSVGLQPVVCSVPGVSLHSGLWEGLVHNTSLPAQLLVFVEVAHSTLVLLIERCPLYVHIYM